MRGQPNPSTLVAATGRAMRRRSQPFDSDQFIYELKIDGFRALAHIEGGQGQLISRNGNTFLESLATPGTAQLKSK